MRIGGENRIVKKKTLRKVRENAAKMKQGNENEDEDEEKSERVGSSYFGVGYVEKKRAKTSFFFVK